MKQNTLLFAIAFCAFLPWAPMAAQEPCIKQRTDENTEKRNRKRPNVILIMADDVGYECFGCYGSKQYRTTALDRLAKQGMRFTHCYSQPVCTPSRVKLMTGLSNVRNYAAFSILRQDQRTIGQYFKEAGYQTMIGGKWQLLGAQHYNKAFRKKGTWPKDAGFDRYCLWQIDQLGGRYWKPLLNIDGNERQFDADVYGPDVVNKYILDFMQENRERPFFAYYPMILVHSPFVPTPDSASREAKDRQRNFEDMVAYTDKLIGRVVAKTKELGIAERTLILFTGDNGTHASITSKLKGESVRGGKAMTTDAGTHVPLIAYWPGFIGQGATCNDLVNFSDFLPTCLAAAGVAIPPDLDGQSFLPQLRGQAGKPRSSIYCYYCPRPEKTEPVRFARNKRWKLYGDGRLFDVEQDVLEQHPLVELNAEAEKARRKLSSALQAMPQEGRSLLDYGPRKP